MLGKLIVGKGGRQAPALLAGKLVAAKRLFEGVGVSRRKSPWAAHSPIRFVRPSKKLPKEAVMRGTLLAGNCLAAFQERYNTMRPHWCLRPALGADPPTPRDVYANGAQIVISSWQHWAKAAKKKLDQMMTAEAQKRAA